MTLCSSAAFWGEQTRALTEPRACCRGRPPPSSSSATQTMVACEWRGWKPRQEAGCERSEVCSVLTVTGCVALCGGAHRILGGLQGGGGGSTLRRLEVGVSGSPLWGISCVCTRGDHQTTHGSHMSHFWHAPPAAATHRAWSGLQQMHNLVPSARGTQATCAGLCAAHRPPHSSPATSYFFCHPTSATHLDNVLLHQLVLLGALLQLLLER